MQGKAPTCWIATADDETIGLRAGELVVQQSPHRYTVHRVLIIGAAALAIGVSHGTLRPIQLAPSAVAADAPTPRPLRLRPAPASRRRLRLRSE